MEWGGALQVYITFTTAGITVLPNRVLVELRVCQDGRGLGGRCVQMGGERFVLGTDEERWVQEVCQDGRGEVHEEEIMVRCMGETN